MEEISGGGDRKIWRSLVAPLGGRRVGILRSFYPKGRIFTLTEIAVQGHDFKLVLSYHEFSVIRIVGIATLEQSM